MQIEFGNEVVANDGSKLGTVAGVVMDARNESVKSLVIGEGLFDQDERLVDISAVTSAEGGVVTLNLSSRDAQGLPEFVRTEYVERPRQMPDDVILPAAGVGGPVFYDSGYVPSGYTDYPGDSSFFEMAPLDPPVVETRSNLGENRVMLNKGTDVVGSDGKKVGTVDDVLFNADGFLTGFVVRAGFLFHHDLSIPASAVSEVDDDAVRLNITSDAAEAMRA